MTCKREPQSELEWFTRTSGSQIAEVPMADFSDGPAVLLMHSPPNASIPVHQHRVRYREVIVRGSQMVGRTWYSEGQIRTVEANQSYGPLIAGPEGCTVLLIYESGDWEPVDPRPVRDSTVKTANPRGRT